MSKKIVKSFVVVLFLVLCLSSKQMTQAADVVPAVTSESKSSQGQSTETATDVQLEDNIAKVAALQESRQLVIIGDSRTVGMKSAVGSNNNIWSAKVGMGLSWMKSTGVPAVESSINSNTDVVILMGVNDVRSLSYTSKYISYLNSKAAEWTGLGANVYYVSVNPMVFETKSYPGITNSVIENWNAKMQEGLSDDINYIDTYSQVLGKLSSKDGIHYNNKSYKLIYSLIKQSIIMDKAIAVTEQI